MSVEYIVATKTATEACNNLELKRKILSAPVLDCDYEKNNYEQDRKKRWDEIVEREATLITENLGIAKELQDTVRGIVLAIGLKMAIWAEYHEGILGLSYGYSVNFLDSSLTTPQGTIDNKKAAEKLMKDENLSIKQKYKLACLYCFTEHIPLLYKQMTKEDKSTFYDSQNPEFVMQPELVKFWSYYLMGDIDKLKGEKSLDQYRLEKAVESGSKAAVQFCLEKTKLVKNKNAVIHAAVETVKNRVKRGPDADGTSFDHYVNDWVVFRDDRYYDGSWVPSHYYVDILHYLLLEMREDQQVEVLKKDIRGIDCGNKVLQPYKHSRVLEYFLDWPYQNRFLKMAELMWEFLPETSFADLLLQISHKIESEKGTLKYGEERSYNYRNLFKEFWHQSTEHHKKYIWSNKKRTLENGKNYILNEGKELVVMLFILENFTREDWQNIQLILASATDEEKQNVIASKEGKDICIFLMKKANWEVLDEFLLNCFPSEEQANKFKQELSFTEKAQHLCIHNIQNKKWNEADSFIKWSSLPDEAINHLKSEMIYSDAGKQACMYLISCEESMEAVNKIIDWCLLSEEEIKVFKRELIFSDLVTESCSILVSRDKIELIDVFATWCLSSHEEIQEFKQNLVHVMGDFICEKLISDSTIEDSYDEQSYTNFRTIKFNGGKWEQVEKFLTWCFSSEEEISEFKRGTLLKSSAVKIHFELIRANQWQEAKTFFAWLGLSSAEIKTLKKVTLYKYDPAVEMLRELMYCNNNTRFTDYGEKQEALELLLRWYLTDRETVCEFSSLFKEICHSQIMTEEGREVFKDFDLAVAQCVNGLDEDRGMKRKSEAISPKSL